MTRLDQIMAERGLSDRDVANLVKCAPNEIWRLRVGKDNGGRKINERWARRLSAALNVPAAELMFQDAGTEEAAPTPAETPPSNLDRYFVVLEGLLEGLGLKESQVSELKSMYLESLQLDLDGLPERADLQARKAVTRASARRFADKVGIRLAEKS